MDVRDKILEAAARVYAEAGFRGATTRRIASEAGVNEITIFRQFGSKSALLGQAVGAAGRGMLDSALPSEPVDPEAELYAWARGHLELLRGKRSLIRACMADFEEHPEMMPPCGSPSARAADALCTYLDTLRARGIATADFDSRAAAVMLMGSLFADAMGRDLMPDLYRRQPEESLGHYLRFFLRGIGVAE
jgi:AcrR family transcriptional regulator